MQTSLAKNSSHANPWSWVPSLYFAQAIPYVVVMSLSVIMYKDMGVSNSDIAFYTSLLYLPWVIKPLWSPIVDMFGSKRRWTVLLQLAVAASLVAVGEWRAGPVANRSRPRYVTMPRNPLARRQLAPISARRTVAARSCLAPTSDFISSA